MVKLVTIIRWFLVDRIVYFLIAQSLNLVGENTVKYHIKVSKKVIIIHVININLSGRIF